MDSFRDSLWHTKNVFLDDSKRFDIGGTVGMFAFNLLIGGMIGSVVLTWIVENLSA